ncbi:MAG: Mg chelatase, subunit ChlI [Candidatus Roizmanbacteria bacterium GW2011_GWC2_37_13]|uniref:Mg chelatase, subunit ChlI n=1 Tax=Candidatus Roizmanbacteria bacterium GW2011_GWC2_37_13 TaxID=1618486 RepID=A0A0G0IPU1_9BACT|nr:MAG: Mg chelatase, subunit ChlI [Candidatus Roizmanbacteria bacterium GW2011_GWC1_37_12]KKQ26164.1 MAG: Mg chelatase, subunit ChlI [Candidatus Roizmanbacteria bacterium GW2011_GWC2_37_13]
MLAKVLSGTTIGLDGVLITVEVDVAERGFPGFTIVGLPDKSVDEAKERVRAAIVNTSFEMPDTRLTINLAPADIHKIGSAFDLPIAIGILAAAGMVKKDQLKKSLFVGELSLEGEVRKVPGVLSISLLARSKKINQIFVPWANVTEAALVDGIEIFPVNALAELILHLNAEILLTQYPHQEQKNHVSYEDNYLFENIKGQATAKRACEIAAAGFHNIIFKGPPGTGKTLLSRAFPSILPDLDKEEILEITKIYSVTGLIKDSQYISQRPFRSPHHTISRIGLVGGGSHPAPGEVSLAHRGVLFLDEFSEFPRTVLEALRQPLEDGIITISRAQGSLTFPCRFLLLAASNPCPCGYLGHPKKSCRCLPGAILKYKKRLSGPLLDRIDLHVDVPPVLEGDLMTDTLSESSEIIRGRVLRARNKQKQRFKNSKIYTNAEMGTSEIKKFCRLSSQALNLLKQAISRLSLSARSYFKTIKIAQTITDLDGKEIIESEAVAEALQFRSHDD